jgi:hypothetical protein
MREKCKRNGPGMRLICAGAIVFLVGLTIILFKELNIPRYWIPAVIGLALMLAGVIVHGIRRVCGHQETKPE